MNPDQFAQTVKQKYPQYASVDNLTLAQKVVAKYPQYASKVNFDTQIPSGNPTFQSNQSDTLGTSVSKVVGNMPSSVVNFAKGAIEQLNPLSTIDKVQQIASPNSDPSAAKVGVGDVIKEIPSAAYHALVPSFLQHLFSGEDNKFDSAKKDIVNDPVGQILPFLLAGEGAAKLADTKLGGLQKSAQAGFDNFNKTGVNTMPTKGVYSQAFDNGISKTAQTAMAPVRASLGKVGDLTGGVAKSAASHLTGLDSSTVEQILASPEAFSKIAQDNMSRGGLAGEVKSAIDQRISDLSSLGKGYEGIKNAEGQVQIPDTLLSDALKQHRVELVDGKVKTGPESLPLSPGDVSALQHFVDTYGNERVLSNNAFLNTRSALSNMSAYDAAKTNNIKVISRSLRSAYDNVGKEQINGLKELDSKYAPETQFLKQVKKDYLNKDGTFKDGAVNKIANSTGVGKDNLLNRLENVMPGISKRVQLLKAVEDIERAKGIKVGSYGRLAAGGVGALAGGIPGFIVAEIVTNPAIAVPLLRGLGYTAAQLAPILQTLRIIAGDHQITQRSGITGENLPVEKTLYEKLVEMNNKKQLEQTQKSEPVKSEPIPDSQLVNSIGKHDMRTVMTNLEKGYSKKDVVKIMTELNKTNTSGRYDPKEISSVASKFKPNIVLPGTVRIPTLQK